MNKKRILTVFCLIALILFAAGCEKKTDSNNASNTSNTENKTKEAEDKKLICELTEKEDDSTDTIKWTISYKGEDVNKVTLLSTTRYTSGKYDEKAAEEASSDCKDALKDAKGFSCNVQKSGASIYITYQFTLADLNEAGNKVAKAAGIDEIKGQSYDAIKSALTSGGYKCS